MAVRIGQGFVHVQGQHATAYTFIKLLVAIDRRDHNTFAHSMASNHIFLTKCSNMGGACLQANGCGEPMCSLLMLLSVGLV